MQIQGVQSLSQISLSAPQQGALDQFSSGDIIEAQVTGAENGKVTLQLPNGQELQASQRTFDTLRPGDTVSFMIASKGEQPGQGVRLELMSVNGQHVNPNATQAEYSLIGMRIAPTQANLAIAASLRRMGAPVQPETFARMNELTTRFASLPQDTALAFAASSLPITESNVAAFSQWMQSPAKTTEFAAALNQLAASDPEAAALILNAAADMLPAAGREAAPAPAPSPGALPAGLSEGLAAKLESGGAWSAIVRELPNLPPEQAQGRILQLMADLPMNATSEERSLIYSALTALRQKPQQPAAEPMQQPAAGALKDAQALPGAPRGEAPPAAAAPQPQDGVQQPVKEALNTLFAAIDKALPGDRGAELKEAAASLAPRIQAMVSAAKGASDPAAAARMKPVAELGQAIVTQVQMGNELGNLMYIPLPVTINQQQQDASLYVLKRNGGSKVDESNVTVAICLDTENLGAVDTLLRVERNELTLQFRVDSKEIRSFMQPRLAGASGIRFPSQYVFRGASVVLRDGAITPANAGQVLQKSFGMPVNGGLDISV